MKKRVKTVVDKVSNNVLVVLIVATILVSVIGTWVSLSKFGAVTGFATGTGTANVTISQSIGITVNPSMVNFTSSAVNEHKDSATAADVNGCGGDNVCGINVTNTGSAVIDVSLNCTDDLFTGTVNATTFRCKVNSNTANYDKGIGGNTNTTYVDCRNSVGYVGGHSQFIDGLNFTNGADNVYVDIDINVPPDEPEGNKGALLYFVSAADS